ncbi:MAG: hypothetical protein SLAVMIC_00823 [uncultured marine phage]|uniref:Uncharacterized protein n=1 Tax=uncultured marine phage TaxID=707152 RepID=A0A8D9FQJ7_9VIRU|nr:MAG: hypothetical protein SLAVMIC_00823 [uncultured marine phage]
MIYKVIDFINPLKKGVLRYIELHKFFIRQSKSYLDRKFSIVKYVKAYFRFMRLSYKSLKHNH